MQIIQPIREERGGRSGGQRVVTLPSINIDGKMDVFIFYGIL